MTWLVDGSNLGGYTGGRSGARDAAAVVGRLQSWMRGRRERVVLVFDGEPDPRVASRYGALEVVWSGAGRSADDRIAAAVSAAGREAPTVVTNDRELQRRCLELGAKVEKVAVLLERVEAPRREPKRAHSPREKPEPTVAEAARWAGVFDASRNEASGAAVLDSRERDPGARLVLAKRRKAAPRTLRVLAGAALLAALSACGGDIYVPITGNFSAAEMAKRPSIDACLLLLRSDVDPDNELGLTKASNMLDGHEGAFFARCGYGTRRPWQYAGIEVRRSLSAEQAAKIQEASRPFLRRLAHEPLIDVPNVGDAAVWAGGQLGQLHVVDGDLRFIFTIEIGADEDRRALATRLGRLAVDRIHALDWDRLKSPAGRAAAS